MKTTGGQLAYRRGFRIPVHCLGHERVEINRDAAFEVTSLAARDYFIPWIPLTSPSFFFQSFTRVASYPKGKLNV